MLQDVDIESILISSMVYFKIINTSLVTKMMIKKNKPSCKIFPKMSTYVTGYDGETK